MTYVHYRNNYICSIQSDDTFYTEPNDIKSHIREFYRRLYSKGDKIQFDISRLHFNCLSAAEGDSLVMAFSEKEIFDALCSCGEKKAPDFFRFNTLPKGINTSFMVLVPKVAGSANIKDYRPTSLVNGFFKLLSKTLSRRLATLLPKVYQFAFPIEVTGPVVACLCLKMVKDRAHGAVVQERLRQVWVRDAFLKGRSIQECTMIANEFVHSALRKKVKLPVLKLDFHKAFDSIEWDYLLLVFRCVKFPANWLKWMSCCFSLATTSVLVNGSPDDPISLQRGVGQGDPISPYQFVLAVEGLKCLLDKIMELGLTRGFSYSYNHDPISMLQFVDGTILYVPNDIKQLRNLTHILRCFELISGLTINFHKITIMGINISEIELLEDAQVVGCRVESFPIKYLGLPLSSWKLAMSSWDHVVERFKSRLALWKGSLLSAADSGLDISNLHVRNQSLLFKWIWKSRVSNNNSLWFKVVSSGSIVVDWDSLINNDVKKLSLAWEILFRFGMIYTWMGDALASILRLAWEILFRFHLSNQKHVTINVIQGWRWRRRLRGNELLLLRDLQASFSVLVPRMDRSDETGQEEIVQQQDGSDLVLHGFDEQERNGSVILHGAVHGNSVSQLNETNNVSFRRQSNVQKSQAPPKVKFFLWLAVQNRLLSLIFLAKRSIISMDNLCSLCGEDEKQEHIFIHYALLENSKLPTEFF
ncbi:uncharacterized protein LOC126681836 [Mercurialis annua]|uniref:uncharacterized protein LOC126681836 n=1 Tax=Mercurialis annua TaxID=3986 RepID=UPI00215F9C10|nr:uncharacterized protein LOC126681836 [Mercurialis annua]